MKRNTFKKGYMILHTAVAVSIVLIGIKVLIGFGQSTYDGAKVVKNKASYQIDKFEDKWQDSKKKKKFIKSMKEQVAFAERMAESYCNDEVVFPDNANWRKDMKICIERKLNDRSNIYALWYQDGKKFLNKVKSNQLKKWNR